MFGDLAEAVATALQDKNLDRFVARTWNFKDTCLVVDLVYRGVRFSFDMTPVADRKTVAIDLVQRTHKGEITLTETGKNKESLADRVRWDGIGDIIGAKTAQIFAAVDKALGPRGGTSVAAGKAGPSGDAARPLTVGVLTLPLNRNNGGCAQAYALMEVLRQLGHKPVLINRRPRPHGFKPGADNPDAPLIHDTLELRPEFPTRQFVADYISPATKPFYTTEDLEDVIDRLDLDAIVVGSDQVWRPKFAMALLMDFFLQFVPGGSKTRRISYAASYGAPKWEFSEDETREAGRLLKSFDAVAVREDNAVEQTKKHFDVDAEHVLDPTMLLCAEHYIKTFSLDTRHADGDRLFGYILSDNDDKVHVIDAFAERLSLTAYAANGLPFDADAKGGGTGGDTSVEGWFASFHKASFVVTDSFHGVAFSIIFNKPFVAYGNPARGLARFTSVLKLFGLEDRLILKSRNMDVEKLVAPIDWDTVNARREALKAQSLDFLVAALTGTRSAAGAPPSAAATPTSTSGGAMSGGAAGGMRAAPADDFSSQICAPLNVLCSGCGVCVSEAEGTLAMGWTHDGFLVPHATADKVPAQAIRVCPFNPDPDKAVKDEDVLAEQFLADASQYNPKAGRYFGSYIGYSKEFRPTSSSGGVATFVFSKLLQQKHVDHLFIVQNDDAGRYKYRLFSDVDSISQISKTRYYPVTMDELFSIINDTPGKVAVSGVACFIKALRLKQHYHPELEARIPFLVGIICGGLKSRRYTDFLADSAGIDGEYVNPEYRVKNPKSSAIDYSFAAHDHEQKRHQMRMGQVGDMWGTGLFKSKACDYCTDVLTELADISVGDAWLPEYRPDGMGNSIVVTRSQLADAIIREGIASGELAIDEAPIDKIIASQGGGYRHKQDTVRFRSFMGRRFYKIPVPAVRARMLRGNSPPAALVQILRERARARSIRVWDETGDSGAFMKRMRSSIKALTVARQKSPVEALSPGQPMIRWMMRKVSDGTVDYDTVRAAMTEGVPKKRRPNA